MRFIETKLKDAYIVDLEVRADDRGGFARTFCTQEFEAHGLQPNVVQSNLSFNYKAGTIRGMHYQVSPACETKFIRCIKGAIYDVIVDLRPASPTYLQHFGVELSAENRRALYIPNMFAHGYQALTDGAEVLYQVSEFYTPDCERGFRYDDPTFAIQWQLPVSVISKKDLDWSPFEVISVGV